MKRAQNYKINKNSFLVTNKVMPKLSWRFFFQIFVFLSEYLNFTTWTVEIVFSNSVYFEESSKRQLIFILFCTRSLVVIIWFQLSLAWKSAESSIKLCQLKIAQNTVILNCDNFFMIEMPKFTYVNFALWKKLLDLALENLVNILGGHGIGNNIHRCHHRLENRCLFPTFMYLNWNLRFHCSL